MRTHITANAPTSALSTESHRVVTREEWLAERQALLAHEKELTRLRDQIAYKRGVEVMMDTYNLLDLTPKGRDAREVAYKME